MVRYSCPTARFALYFKGVWRTVLQADDLLHVVEPDVCMILPGIRVLPPLLNVKAHTCVADRNIKSVLFLPYPDADLPILLLPSSQTVNNGVLHHGLEQEFPDMILHTILIRLGLQLKIHKSCLLDHRVILHQFQFISNRVGLVVHSRCIPEDIDQGFDEMLDILLFVQHRHPLDRVQSIVDETRGELGGERHHPLPVS